jgi:ABC-type multidrug transport system fused ATPase/permease subunit
LHKWTVTLTICMYAIQHQTGAHHPTYSRCCSTQCTDIPQQTQVEGLCIRYRPELPLVLDHVSFSVAAGSKVGIVGRTGSGKSSLLLALYRLMEAEAGCVRIDGVDVRTLGLTQVRRSPIPSRRYKTVHAVTLPPDSP